LISAFPSTPRRMETFVADIACFPSLGVAPMTDQRSGDRR
jgi:hypothetical protein